MEEAILENCTVPAHTEVDWAPETSYSADLKCSLQVPDLTTSAEHPLCCTSVSWSSTGKHSLYRCLQCQWHLLSALPSRCGYAAGQGIAVSYGRFDAEGWCLEAGRLCTWNLARPGFDASRPDVTLEVDSCLQCCAYHPEQPVNLQYCKYCNAAISDTKSNGPLHECVQRHVTSTALQCTIWAVVQQCQMQEIAVVMQVCYVEPKCSRHRHCDFACLHSVIKTILP